MLLAVAGSRSNHQSNQKTERLNMVLYIIGLGLHDEKDITVRGLELIKSSSKVFLEAYTSVLSIGKERLEAFYGRDDIVIADRDFVECRAEEIYLPAKDGDVSFLVVGDPVCATTVSMKKYVDEMIDC
jgi:diphthine synthase